MSDTPRTDEAECFIDSDRGIIDSGLGRQLERELNRACEMYRKLDIHTLNLVDRIRRLEEAGDDLYVGWGSERNNKDKYLENWKQAKEAKP